MSVSSMARTHWNGDLTTGSGRTLLATSGAAELDVHWKARSEGSTSVTTPEELLAAALSSCFSMALSKTVADEGHAPDHIEAEATVTFVPGQGVTTASISVKATIDGLASDRFDEIVAAVKDGCPISQALSIDVTLGDVSLAP